ncbi:MAG TPA: Ig domain-containing protein, partial [Candidatus Lambdaproteobacteria bacterium]|nr:Ig domain-containing protein [Candidatus Lambdaproteobacteria bacterium]
MLSLILVLGCTSSSDDGSGSADDTTTTTDSTAPVIAEVTAVTTPTNDTTPNYTFSSTEAGTITYGGSCSSNTTSATSGKNTITLVSLGEGTYLNCTIIVTDATGNVSSSLSMNSFVVDTTAPSVGGCEITTPTSDNTPECRFTSSEAGTLTLGACSSSTTTAVIGLNIITFNALSDGTYTNCLILVTDLAGNNGAYIIYFTVDTTAPTLSQVTAVTTPTNDNTSSYTFSSNEAGTISYGGSCSSSITTAVAGDNAIAFNELGEGTYSDCEISVTDSLGHTSDNLSVSSFTIDTIAPVIAQVTTVTTTTNDNTPSYTFSSTKAGTISYGGSCSSGNTSATADNNTITFNALADGAFSNCTIKVTDNASNQSNTLSVSSFTVDTTAPTLSQVTAVTT